MSEKTVIESEELEKAEAKKAAEKDALKRRAFPQGWPAESVEAMEPELGAQVEALINDVECPSHRLRPAFASDRSDRVNVQVLDGTGEAIEAAKAVEALAATLRLRRLSAEVVDFRVLQLRLAAAPVAAAAESTGEPAGDATHETEPPAKSRARR